MQTTTAVENRSKLAALARAGERIGRALRRDELGRAVSEAGAELLDAEVCCLGLLEPETEEIAFLGDARASIRCRVPLGRGILGGLADGDKPIIANDLHNDARIFDGEDPFECHGVDSLLGVPLRSNGRLLGVVVALNSRREHGFVEADAERACALVRHILVALERTSRVGRLCATREALSNSLPDSTRALVGSSQRIRQLVEKARQAANRHAPILLTGEPGTGHQELARTIHSWSPRREGPFVSLHFSALSPEQQGFALFGRGDSFPTADPGEFRGAVERAAGGTLFLGEVGALSPPHQATLLRVIEEQTFRPVGGDDDRRCDLRVIAATRRDLRSQVRRGCFSQQLHSRLCVVLIDLPSLRERGEDIPLLAETLVEQLCRQHDRALLRIGPAALECLVGYAWPGNLAELANALERAVLLAKGEGIGVRLLPPEVRGWSVAADKPDVGGCDEQVPLSRAVEKFKSDRIQNALAQTGGNQTRAARLLGLQQSNLSRMIKNLRIR